MASAPVWQSATSITPGSAASAIFTLPASIAANDIVVLTLYREIESAVTPPAGFAELTSVATTTGIHQQMILWKRMAGGESGTVTATWTGADWRSGTAHRITGCVTSGSPWYATFNTAVDNTDGVTLNLPAVSLADSPTDSLLFWAATNFSGSTTVWTPPTGFTNRASQNVLVASTKDNTAGGATGSLVGSCNLGSNTKTAFVGVLLPVSETATQGPILISPFAELPFAEEQAPWEWRPAQPPIPMVVWTSPSGEAGAPSDVPLDDTAAAVDDLASEAAVPLADTAAAADALSTTAILDLADTASAADSLAAGVPISLADTATASDALTISTTLGLADTAAASDSLSTSAAVPLSDTASAAEALTAGVPISFADTAAVADALSVTTALPLADTAAAADSLSVSAPAAVDPYQAGPQIARMFLDPSEASIQLQGASDTPPVAAVGLGDTASAADSLSVVVAAPLADTATATDSMIISVVLTLADVAAASEFMAAGVPIALADTAAASDALSSTATLPLADTAIATDALTANAALVLADTAAAAELLAAGVPKTLSDTASASDALLVGAVAVPLADTASAADVLASPSFPVSGPVQESRVSTGTDARRAATGSERVRGETGTDVRRGRTGNDPRRVSTGNDMFRITTDLE